MKLRLLACLFVTTIICCISIFVRPAPGTVKPGQVPTDTPVISSGGLEIIDKTGKPSGFIPLKHTEIKTEISGFVAHISVTQEFENQLPDAVEAIYVFPLPHDSAVDGMTMRVGDREIRAVIHERNEAQEIYAAARGAGHTAALLDQERSNIFTQSVANIPPHAKVEITLSVLEMLKYEGGTYEFAFPLVVGPRYVPGAPTGIPGRGMSPDTPQVPDASHISPPVAGVDTPNFSAGHEVSIEVNLTAGVPIGDVISTSHKILVYRTGSDSFKIRLAEEAVRPNKDFILKYTVAASGIEDAVLTHADKSGSYFTLILQPPDRITDQSVVPRELIFVLDTSGSMSGFPIEMAKQTIRRALDNLRSHETFNLITFSGDTRILFPKGVPATPENVAAAKQVLAGQYGAGGTEMMSAIRAALGDDAEQDKPAGEADPVRIVCFMTDGYVGNDQEIVAEVKKHSNARVFAFGIGTSVNRFLLSKMAEEGRGEAEFVTNPEEAEPAADRFYERVHSPVLTNISVDWNGLPVTDILPARISDLFSAKPVIITGRYAGSATGTIFIRGTQAGGDFKRAISLNFPAENPANSALEKLWARGKVEDLMSKDWLGAQQGVSAHKKEIVAVGLEHSLATQYTSFVAVETRTVVSDGKPVRIEVPVELPEKVSPLAVPRNGGRDAYGTFAENSLASIAVSGRSLTMTILKNASPRAETVTVQTQAVEVTSSDQALVPIRGRSVSKVKDEKKQKAANAELQLMSAKLSPDLLSLYLCSTQSSPTHGSGADGKGCSPSAAKTVKVMVDVGILSRDIVNKLKKAGLHVNQSHASGTVEGEILTADLGGLALIREVKSVALSPDYS